MTHSMSPATSFAEFGVRKQIVDALAAGDINAPLPIQAATLTDSIAGRDVLGRGRTGSGKTLAFSIPLVERLAASGGSNRPSHPAGLILAPTRELATQIAAALYPMARACGLTVTTIFGGVPQNRQAKALKAGADIVVACPGRLEDLMKQRLVFLDNVQITVLDEADHMADLGFLPGVTRILAATPANGQRLLFSATLDNGVDKLVKRFMRNPLSHSVDDAQASVPDMTHHVFEVAGADAKRDLINTLASGEGRRILFMRTKHHARRLAKQLTMAGIPATDLHGNLSQAARDRNLAQFAAGTARVLVATDVAARGVHVDDVELVVHVDPPAEHKAYLHRSGRTARAGSSGDVVTVVLPEQRKDVAMLLRKAGLNVVPERVTAHSPSVTTLVGPVAPFVAPRNMGPDTDDRDLADGGRNRRGGGPRGGSQSARPVNGRPAVGRGGSRGAATGASTRGASNGSPRTTTGGTRSAGNGASRGAQSGERRASGGAAPARREYRSETPAAAGTATRNADSTGARAHAGAPPRRRASRPQSATGEQFPRNPRY